ncbi:MAG TPA: hypothetical protein VLJ86_27805 [Ramlibacter sp.]|nr:hypothetical protein [Ramlibacter sp.]
MSQASIAASYGLYYASPPQAGDGSIESTWITRSANVVVAVSQVRAGALLARQDNPDEYMLLLPPGVRAEVTAGDASITAGADSLTIVPPGASSVRVLDAGAITRVFSVRAVDLAGLASNAQHYAAGAPSVAPLEDWPMPVGGYRLRHYELAKFLDPKLFGRLFRSRNLMINVFERKDERRDPAKLSPHSHGDFEQISLAMEGSFIHHLRTPWGPDSNQWKDDEHVEVHSPSTIVIPTNLVHTTQATGKGVNWLIDIFGPPRRDFSSQAGLVRNEDEYPMPG